jgi:hypothetical protein
MGVDKDVWAGAWMIRARMDASLTTEIEAKGAKEAGGAG